jgi:hypothetical protein
MEDLERDEVLNSFFDVEGWESAECVMDASLSSQDSEDEKQSLNADLCPTECQMNTEKSPPPEESEGELTKSNFWKKRKRLLILFVVVISFTIIADVLIFIFFHAPFGIEKTDIFFSKI